MSQQANDAATEAAGTAATNAANAVLSQETARIQLGNQIAADIQSIREDIATAKSTESEHYTEVQPHLTAIYKRLSAAETKFSDIETRVQTIEAHLNFTVSSGGTGDGFEGL